MQLIKEIGGEENIIGMLPGRNIFAIFPGDFFERKTFGQGNKYLGNFVQNDEDGQLGNSKVKMDCWRIGPLQKKFEFVFFVFS